MNNLHNEGKFIVNGLSDVRKGMKGESTAQATTTQANQGFDVKYDRSVCPVPWWGDTLTLSLDSEEGVEVDGREENTKMLHSIQIKLQRLRLELSEILDRPTMMDSNLGHECYYSQSAPGSSLARHMDERHEETKGPRGWLLPSRRSLSWLIYLSETNETNADEANDRETTDERCNRDEGIEGNGKDWDPILNGGLLRTFPQKHYRQHDKEGWDDTVQCGCHNGNLQVGWLLADETKDGGEEKLPLQTHPVFLDSWFDYNNPYTGIAEPHCVLYIVRRTPSSNGELQIEHLTEPWIAEAIQGSVVEFLKQRATMELESATPITPSLFLQPTYAKHFRLLEDREAWTRGHDPDGSVIEDTVPTRGTLVVFDSTTLPHEVTAVVEGTRAALAGWYHEETQPFGGGGGSDSPPLKSVIFPPPPSSSMRPTRMIPP
eukprot:scaffold1899_cov182-Alexandrium_tamarense.AAC.4